MSVEMLGLNRAQIRQNGTGNAVSEGATVQNKDGLNLLVRNLTSGTLALEIWDGNGWYQFENIVWDLATLPGPGLGANTTGAAAIFIQIARGLRYRLSSVATTDLYATVIDTGNT